MSTFDTLPIILVSAANEAATTTVISELIDNDVTDDYCKDINSSDRVWRLVNKYYTANVRVHPFTDDRILDVDPDAVEAYIIYITEEELSGAGGGVAAAAARAAAGAGAWRACGVRLLLAAAAAEPRALAAWAGAARALPVALREPAPAPGPFGAGAGAARARAALHAHAWRGLRRTDRAPRPPPHPRTEAGSGSSSGSEDADADELRAVEHAEVFAAALGALGPALELGARGPALGPSPGPAPGPALGPAGERHERAEALVAAFCRALGYDLDAC